MTQRPIEITINALIELLKTYLEETENNSFIRIDFKIREDKVKIHFHLKHKDRLSQMFFNTICVHSLNHSIIRIGKIMSDYDRSDTIVQVTKVNENLYNVTNTMNEDKLLTEILTNN